MKKRKRLLFIIIPSVLLVGLAVALVILMPFLLMKPASSGFVGETGIYAIKNSRNNMFAIESDDGYILIDAGTDIDDVEKSLNEADISPEEVAHVLLTHTHYDHVGALPLFSDARIYVGEGENIDNISGDITQLEDLQELSIGGHTIQCISSQGHTAGSMSYILDDKYLFTGDSVRIDNYKLVEHPFSEDGTESEGTINKLFSAMDGKELVLTSHYGFYYPSLLRLE